MNQSINHSGNDSQLSVPSLCLQQKGPDTVPHDKRPAAPAPDEVRSERSMDMPAPEDAFIPTTVVPLYRKRLVMLQIGDRFLRVGTGSKPVVR